MNCWWLLQFSTHFTKESFLYHYHHLRIPCSKHCPFIHVTSLPCIQSSKLGICPFAFLHLFLSNNSFISTYIIFCTFANCRERTTEGMFNTVRSIKYKRQKSPSKPWYFNGKGDSQDKAPFSPASFKDSWRPVDKVEWRDEKLLERLLRLIHRASCLRVCSC